MHITIVPPVQSLNFSGRKKKLYTTILHTIIDYIWKSKFSSYERTNIHVKCDNLIYIRSCCNFRPGGYMVAYNLGEQFNFVLLLPDVQNINTQHCRRLGNTRFYVFFLYTKAITPSVFIQIGYYFLTST